MPNLFANPVAKVAAWDSVSLPQMVRVALETLALSLQALATIQSAEGNLLLKLEKSELLATEEAREVRVLSDRGKER